MSTPCIADNKVACKRGHVLLVSPLTFSYHLAISDALQELGYQVTWWDERASSATWYKLSLRMFPRYTKVWSERWFLRRLNELEPSTITHLLVVKGEGLSRRVVLEMRRRFNMASAGLYLWDGVENVKGVLDIAPAFDSVATFDPQDAQAFGWEYRPLFARKTSAPKNHAASTRYDWCFIGTMHSDRHRVIHRLRRAGGAGTRTFVFAFFQSPLILAIRRLSDWTLWFAPKGTLSTRPMNADEMGEIVRSSTSVLDVEHPKQRGFTMRTIETLLANKKLVTTNEQIVNSDLYHPSRAHVISRTAPHIPASFTAQPFLAVPDSIRRNYLCRNWAEDLITLQDEARSKANPTPEHSV